ncbi:cathepsin O-like [Cimex lectularius]|uniref:Cathepsin O n=1 Tax=Cimex lectularius TaxID=79782 RepID=A0A8I6RV40_CIMLE|nr:cathepsin O-like [Cimex lectularius]
MEKWKFWFSILVFAGLCFLALRFTLTVRNEESEEHLFASFLKKYRRNYTEESEEYKSRLDAFKNAVKLTKEWNNGRTSELSALYGITQFADILSKDFSKKYLRGRSHAKIHKHTHYHHHHHDNVTAQRIKRAIDVDLPNVVDWRNKNVVNSVKDQKLCGACWAFSTVGVIESIAAIKTGVLPTLSVQQMIDCARNGNMGCVGGDPCSLVEWLDENNIKVVSELDYPLLLKDNACIVKKSDYGIRIADYTCDYLVGKEEKLLKMLALHGPVAAAVNALSWQFYLGGVIESHCDGALDKLNHAVQIVGYDLTSSLPHYIVKNSWGKYFGEKGYVRVAIGANVCGIASEITSLDVIT